MSRDARPGLTWVCHHLGDPVVVGQEHGQVLGLLDRLGVRHLPQELRRPGTGCCREGCSSTAGLGRASWAPSLS